MNLRREGQRRKLMRYSTRYSYAIHSRQWRSLKRYLDHGRRWDYRQTYNKAQKSITWVHHSGSARRSTWGKSDRSKLLCYYWDVRVVCCGCGYKSSEDGYGGYCIVYIARYSLFPVAFFQISKDISNNIMDYYLYADHESTLSSLYDEGASRWIVLSFYY